MSDWGAGAGAFLYGARHFLPPSIRKLVSLVGIEDDKAVFKALTKSVEKYESIHGRDEKLTIAHGNSARIHGGASVQSLSRTRCNMMAQARRGH